MDHVAILKKAKIKDGDNLLQEIINGQKTIESRWYVNKASPWNKINKNDRVFFKESGGSIACMAKVDSVIQYENLDENTVNEIIDKYGKKISPNTTKEEFEKWAKENINKRYCILVFLKEVQKIKPFQINKKGFGMSSAWMAVEDIEKIKIC